MKNNSKTWFAAVLVLVFAAGALGGALIGYNRARTTMAAQCARAPKQEKSKPWMHKGGPGKHEPSKEEIKKMFLSRITEELTLSDEQVQQAGAIFDAQHEQIMGLRDQMQERFQAIEDDTVAQLEEILDADQKTRLEKIVKEHRAMRDKDGRRPPLFMKDRRGDESEKRGHGKGK